MKKLVSVMSILFLITLMIYSKSNMEAVKQGLDLWVNTVIPSLFPFFIATEILCCTNLVSVLGKILYKPIHKIFGVPGEGAFAFIMGIISGYPSGAKIVSELKAQEILTQEESERLIAFTNNAGPLFILGTVGISLLQNSKIGYILLISHLISCILVGIVFRNWKKESNQIFSRKYFHRKVPSQDFGEILSNSIQKAIDTIMMIGGFIVFFSVFLSILQSSGFFSVIGFLFEKIGIKKDFGNAICSGIIELTNGVKKICCFKITKIHIAWISFLIGFGGFSVLFQVHSILNKAKISIKPYLYGKILQACFSFLITWFLINL